MSEHHHTNGEHDLGGASAPLVQGHELHLYVVEFHGSGIKVGVSGNPEKRIAQHRRDASAFGFTVGRVWVSSPHLDSEARQNERAIKALAGVKGIREYLPIGFDSAVAHAVSLPRTRVTPDAVAARHEATEQIFEFALGRLGRSLR